MQSDYLIVGQGLTGSVAAFLLEAAGRSTVLVDQPGLSRCSRVAAGIYNPIAGKRMVLAPDFAEKWQRAEALYREAETRLDRRLLHPRPTLRVFKNADEHAAWTKRLDDPAYQPFFGTAYEPDEAPAVRSEWGACEILGTGNLDIPALLDGVRDRSTVIKDRFDPADCAIGPDGIHWKDVRAERLLLCEGHLGAQQPWFPEAGFEPAKGEIMTLRIPGFPEEHITVKGTWLLPLGDAWFKAGSTYHWEGLDDRVTAEGPARIEAGVRSITELPWSEQSEVLAGVRPSTRTREPILQQHAEHPHIAMINGLGARGVVHAPSLCAQAIDLLER